MNKNNCCDRNYTQIQCKCIKDNVRTPTQQASKKFRSGFHSFQSSNAQERRENPSGFFKKYQQSGKIMFSRQINLFLCLLLNLWGLCNVLLNLLGLTLAEKYLSFMSDAYGMDIAPLNTFESQVIPVNVHNLLKFLDQIWQPFECFP